MANDTFLPVQKLLCQTETPVSRANWFHRSKAAALMREIVNGRIHLSHDSLDQNRSSAAEYVRRILVETNLLPPRSEVLARAERAIATTISAQQPELQRQLTSYAMWGLLRDLRKREHKVQLTQGHQMRAQRAVHAAAALLAQNTTQNSGITQETLDEFLDDYPRYRLDVLKFLRWQSRTTKTEPPAIWLPGPRLPTVSTNVNSLRAQIERLSTDTSLPTRVRVAGLCVALFGQTLTKLVQLTTAHHTETDLGDQLLLGSTPVTLPPMLTSLLRELRAQPQRWAFGEHSNRWLFPSIHPGVPMSVKALGEDLRRHGVVTSTLRAAALHNLASHIPVGVLTEVTGLGVQAAIRWAEVSGRSWADYVGLRATSQNNRH